MARLPDSSSLGARPTPRPSLGVAGYQPVRDNLDQKISQAGKELEIAGKIIEETNLKQDRMAAEAALNRLQEQRLTLEYDQQQGFRSVREGNAVGKQFTDAFQGRFDDTARAIEDGLSNEQQKRLFKERIPVIGLQYKSSLLEHQARQTEAFNDSTERNTLELEVKSAAMRPTDDAALQTSLVRMNAALDSRGQRLGLPAEEVTALKSKYQSAAYAARVSSFLIGVPGVVDQNPYTALALIEKDREKMLPETVLELTQKATTAIRLLENQQRIENDRGLKEAEKTVEEAFKFALSGAMPSEEYAAVVRAKTAAYPQFAARADAVLRQATTGAMHGTKSIPQQQDAIRRVEATLARGSSPEAEEVMGWTRQITNTQIAAYKENPWAAAARFQRQPSVPDTPLPSAEAVPGYVQQILPLMSRIEAVAGPSIDVSPLQPAQAQAFSLQLSALPPGPRSEVLGQTGQQLNAQQIQALSDQLDKGNRPQALALKLGADRTTAGRMASELVLRGADAIKDKTVKRDDSQLTGWRSEIANLVRGTLGDAQAEQDVIDAAYYTRVAMDHEGTAIPGFNLEASNENAVRMVIGQPINRSGVKTVLPRGMTEDQFDEKLRSYTPERLQEIAPVVYVRGQKRTPAQLSTALPSMGLRRDATGKYTPVSGGAFVTIDPEGQIPLALEIQ